MFDRLLTKLKKTNPAHEIIPIVESMGDCAISVEYIKIALEDPVDVLPEKFKLETLLKKKDRLYSSRAVLSNKFHHCKTDTDRKEVSIAIKAIQLQIIEVRNQIEGYYETGKLPDVVEKKLLPVDGRRQQKKLHSVRSSISRYKRLMSRTQDQERIKQYEKRITDLQFLANQLSV